MSLLENVQELNALVGQGQLKEAIEKFYADDVEIVEPTGETFHGKETQKGRVDEWVGMLSEMHGGGVRAIAVNEETGSAFIETWTDVTFKEGGRMLMEEVAAQTWEDGKIKRERFYYNMPGQ